MADPSESAPSPRGMVDCHVHVAAFPDGENGCYISSKLLRSPLFRFLLWKHGLDPKTPRRANRKYMEDLLEELGQSRHVEKVVLLGMDGVYDDGGTLDLSGTDLLVGNDYVLRMAKAFAGVCLAGVSINPRRRDAIDELHRCADAGAVLVKVLPNVQRFDPGDTRYKALYREMARRRMPLLSHVGYEFSLIGSDQSLGDPNRLRAPLDEGVTVIAAHACSSGLMFYEKFHPTFFELIGAYRNFFADVSALTLPNRLKTLLLLRNHPEVHHRLVFGTDYPVSVFHLPAWFRIEREAVCDIVNTANRFDRQFKICRSLGIHVRSFDGIMGA